MKQKTHSGTKKRVKITGTGKFMFQKACKNHLLSSKSKRQKKLGRLGIQVSPGIAKKLGRLLRMAR
jgi:large subunit ribosomal protein L35